MFTGTNVWQLIRLRTAEHPDRPAIEWRPFAGEGRTITYGELEREAAAVASGLGKRGIRAGDRVLIHLDNCPEFLLSWFACAAIGAVAVTTNTRSTRAELRYFAEHSGAVAAITQPRLAALVQEAAPGLRWIAVTDHDAGARTTSPTRADSFAALGADPNDLLPAAPDPLALMSVQYTSGTTGRPKGVRWTHANALWAARVNSLHHGLHSTDCHLVYQPLFHANALGGATLPSIWVGGRIVLTPKWSTSRFWDISLREGCTWLLLMGLSIRAIEAMDAPARHSYRRFGFGFSDAPWDERFGVKTVGGWGMTETVAHAIAGDPYLPNRPLAVGRPAPEYGVAVVRADGSPVEPEETGHLLVLGTPGLSLFDGYLDDDQATVDSFDEHGWFRTGDLVRPHADGHISFVDRAKDVLRVGAENVAASEVERVLLEDGSVVEAAVVGRPDAKLDEVPVAFVRTAGPVPGLADRLIERCADALADFKVPRAVYAVRELPRSTMSKINKVALRAVADAHADRAAAEARWLAAANTDPSGDLG
ncbi:crotonobetaine/carnitine-CoA ligase [Allokutzneria albata]|uniref:Crotonobetaine/carnitine-CoA ligase n=2 Tax=Allokutzneria albata TaxID=211114 RepID=A0A1G9T014_ALLAB|nr:crotonobetaine/carnitine-CoA ligase [Allokutzneria albata]